MPSATEKTVAEQALKKNERLVSFAKRTKKRIDTHGSYPEI